MKQQRGFTLIELIAFILVVAIVATGLLVGVNHALRSSGPSTRTTEASFLANARMQVILMKRGVDGYTALSDPCTTTPSLALCTALSNYATAQGFTVVTSISAGPNPKVVSVTVTGSGNATVTSRVYNYASN